MLSKRHKPNRITRINSRVGRNINRSIILNTVRRHQPISRSSIAESTLLNKSTVSSIVSSLIEEDLLAESPDRSGGVGRNPVNLNIRQGRHFVGAIAFDAPCTRVAIVDIDGTVKARCEIWTKAVPPDILLSQCLAQLNSFRSSLGPHKFHGIGVTVAGIVDSAQSQVIYASNLGWKNVDLGAVMQAHATDINFTGVENDAKASAIAELLFGRNRLESQNMIFLLIGLGIGAGIAVHGKILSGNTHGAGEVGHMTVAEGGELCSCGNRGCWQLYASEHAPLRWYASAKQSASSSPYALSDVFGAARAGDSDAQHALRLWGEHVGVGLGDLVRILDPEAVVVGGSINQVWDLVSEEIVNAAYGRGTFALERTTAILPSSLIDYPPLLGAAALSIRPIFADFSISQ
ncbi:MAG: ROK family transcriptional regulator [Ignavibacteria bacterium]|nr:ROK family transcriptional regulator [Ignavibacteria bacterium]